ncbi:MAG: TonB-dependent receptor [Bacteroidaceae bacterium]|nr:TonB-dependent receptor [Bacteroidaceae bacterium]
MRKKLTLIAAMVAVGQYAVAQAPADSSNVDNESLFSFTEAQLGEDDDVTQNVTIISSSNDLYASSVGYAFSPMRFRYRSYSPKYNDVYINGMQMNDMESGQFRFSQIGGLNAQTRSVEFALPSESSLFTIGSIGGSNNYNFRAGSMPGGHRVTLSAANRGYTFRAGHSYSSGFNNKGWAFSTGLMYRWAGSNTGYIKGCFYNSFSYYLGIEKILGAKHHLSFATWGNPTERSASGASTDEGYWLANSNFYNPYWGYQKGKIRNSRVVNDFTPSALFTWDWTISPKTNLTTTLGGKYSIYKSTKLNYNNADNPQPDYYKNMPSNFYNVYNPSANARLETDLLAWQNAYDYWTASEGNRQIQWDKLYYANQQASAAGKDAMYYIEARRNHNLNLQLNSFINHRLSQSIQLNAGLGLGYNHNRHFKTLDDLLGASTFNNLNNYIIGNNATDAPIVQYDVRRPNRVVREGDVFGYDYYINVEKANAWVSYVQDYRFVHFSLAGRLGYTGMQRDGRMENGLAIGNSYGKSGTARFLDGGARFGVTANLGKGHAVLVGLNWEKRAPQASAAFVAPEINNDFVLGLKNEDVMGAEFGYQLKSRLVSFNINGYYTLMNHVSDWTCYYDDNANSFTYVSLTNQKQSFYGLEGGLKVRLTGALDFKALGTIGDAKITNNADICYMKSTDAKATAEKVYSKNMRVNGTPLTATSLGLSYHQGGWYIDVAANWYNRIYLSWTPCSRYETALKNRQSAGEVIYDNDGNLLESALEQAKGHGGWMVDASIGKSIYLKKGSLSINLSLTNLLNNCRMTSGGYEQSRTDYSASGNARTYMFSANPKKFYAYGTNGLLNITYKF